MKEQGRHSQFFKSMRACRMPALVACAIFALGCESGSEGTGGGTGTGSGTGTGTATQVNNLGVLCTMAGGECGSGHQCIFLSNGSDTQGSCTPICDTTADCTLGYEGQFTGEVNCFDQPAPQSCTILCDPGAAGDCPSTLSCITTGGPNSFCGVPE